MMLRSIFVKLIHDARDGEKCSPMNLSTSFAHKTGENGMNEKPKEGAEGEYARRESNNE